MNTRRSSVLARSLLGLAALVLAAPPARAQSAVSARVVPVTGTVSAAAGAASNESVRCQGDVKLTTRAVSDPPPPADAPSVGATTPLPPGVVVSIDTSGVSCTGQSTRAPFAAAAQANLTRLLAPTDVIETTFAIYRDVPGGVEQARTGLLTLTLGYDTATGALTSATAALGNQR